MPGELWEIVRADELKVGDAYVPHASRGVDPSEITSIYRADGSDVLRIEVSDGCHDWMHESRLAHRRYTGHHPDVLMRAMRLMHFALYDEKTHVPMAGDPQNYIRQAEAEIAKERNDGE